MSESDSNSSPQTNTSNTTEQTDRRVGVSEGGVAATEGSTVMIQDVSPEAVAAAVNAQLATSVAAFDATRDVAGRAFIATASAAESAADLGKTAVAANRDVSESVISAARLIVADSNALTEKTREGNQELVKLVADKLSTAVADERRNVNEQIVTNLAKYGAAALIGVGLVSALMSRRKAA